MAKFCTHCGNEVHEQAVVCVKCGCPIPTAQTCSTQTIPYYVDRQQDLVQTISQRFQINGIIWIVISIIQILLGIALDWFFLIIGILNLISSIRDISYSKSFPLNPVGIVDKTTPLVGPIITLIYNLIFGGVIGAVGSIYYLVAIRGYVLENKSQFLEIENLQNNN